MFRHHRRAWTGPKTLLVEDDYQRRLTKRSITLTRKAAENFDWLRRRGGEDFINRNGSALGGHQPLEYARRAFVAHHTDRLNITHCDSLLHALPQATKPQRSAKAAGVSPCRVQPANGMWGSGATPWRSIASSAWWPNMARKKCLFEPQFGWHHSAFDLVTAIRCKSIDEWPARAPITIVAPAEIAIGGLRRS